MDRPEKPFRDRCAREYWFAFDVIKKQKALDAHFLGMRGGRPDEMGSFLTPWIRLELHTLKGSGNGNGLMESFHVCYLNQEELGTGPSPMCEKVATPPRNRRGGGQKGNGKFN